MDEPNQEETLRTLHRNRVHLTQLLEKGRKNDTQFANRIQSIQEQVRQLQDEMGNLVIARETNTASNESLEKRLAKTNAKIKALVDRLHADRPDNVRLSVETHNLDAGDEVRGVHGTTASSSPTSSLGNSPDTATARQEQDNSDDEKTTGPLRRGVNRLNISEPPRQNAAALQFAEYIKHGGGSSDESSNDDIEGDNLGPPPHAPSFASQNAASVQQQQMQYNNYWAGHGSWNPNPQHAPYPPPPPPQAPMAPPPPPPPPQGAAAFPPQNNNARSRLSANLEAATGTITNLSEFRAFMKNTLPDIFGSRDSLQNFKHHITLKNIVTVLGEHKIWSKDYMPEFYRPRLQSKYQVLSFRTSFVGKKQLFDLLLWGVRCICH